jgi:hypothetical protein
MMALPVKEALVTTTVTLAVLAPFFLFVAFGWPGSPDSCVFERTATASNTCYCELFKQAEIGKPGVRQPFNTWSNLYSIGAGAFLAVMVYLNRAHGLPAGRNRMRSTDFYPLLYIGVVIFLGLGSMWFHASLVQWGGVVDNLSMYTFAVFLWSYTLVRMTNRDWPFYATYPTAVVLFTVLNALGIPGWAIIVVLTFAYFVCEGLIAFTMPQVRSDSFGVAAYYAPALISFGAACLVWMFSQSGERLCAAAATFQWHAVWHWLAGVTAVLLYFYWRAARA